MRIYILCWICLILWACASAARAQNTAPAGDLVSQAARVIPSARQLTWQQLEFIAFIHFTVNAFTDREWGEGTEDPALFNPTALDARQWVRVCRDAGMKMVILTAKHHDGFCLWPSAYTKHSVKNSPWRAGAGDVVRETADACREYGLKFGVYLSPWDRHEPAYGDSPRYNEYFKNQLRELLMNYGEISEVWFDGACGEGPNGKRQEYDWPGYYAVIRELQPNAVIAISGPDVRWVGNESGFGRETEWSVIPEYGPTPEMPWDVPVSLDHMAEDLGSRKRLTGATRLRWFPAEACVSIRPGWFYHASQDSKVKTPAELETIYYETVGRNCVLLLNLPPDSRGLIHENDIAALEGLRKILDATFGENLAEGARIITPAGKPHGAQEAAAALTDGCLETYWTPNGEIESRPGLEFELREAKTFNRAMLQEAITLGQRVESFELQAWRNGRWETFAAGTTIGYKRLLRFEPLTASRVRLLLPETRGVPAIAGFGLYRAPETTGAPAGR